MISEELLYQLFIGTIKPILDSHSSRFDRLEQMIAHSISLVEKTYYNDQQYSQQGNGLKNSQSNTVLEQQRTMKTSQSTALLAKTIKEPQKEQEKEKSQPIKKITPQVLIKTDDKVSKPKVEAKQPIRTRPQTSLSTIDTVSPANKTVQVIKKTQTPQSGIQQQKQEKKEIDQLFVNMQVDQNLDGDYNLLADEPLEKKIIINDLQYVDQTVDKIIQLFYYPAFTAKIAIKILKEEQKLHPNDYKLIVNNLSIETKQKFKQGFDELQYVKNLMANILEEQPKLNIIETNWMDQWVRRAIDLVNVDDLLKIQTPDIRLLDILETWLIFTEQPIDRRQDTKFWTDVQSHFLLNQEKLVTQFLSMDSQPIPIQRIIQLESLIIKYPHILQQDIYEEIDTVSSGICYLLIAIANHFGLVETAIESRKIYLMEKKIKQLTDTIIELNKLQNEL